MLKWTSFQATKPNILPHWNLLLSTLPVQKHMYLKARPKALTEKPAFTGPWVLGNSAWTEWYFGMIFWKQDKTLNNTWFGTWLWRLIKFCKIKLRPCKQGVIFMETDCAKQIKEDTISCIYVSVSSAKKKIRFCFCKCNSLTGCYTYFERLFC